MQVVNASACSLEETAQRALTGPVRMIPRFLQEGPDPVICAT